jgi:hypothetical protein
MKLSSFWEMTILLVNCWSGFSPHRKNLTERRRQEIPVNFKNLATQYRKRHPCAEKTLAQGAANVGIPPNV